MSALNSPIYALFDEHFQVDSSSLSTVAFKAIASSIFDRSLRVHSMFPIFRLVLLPDFSNLSFKDSWPRDGGAWSFHVSAEVALKNLSCWVDPFPGRGSTVSSEPYFDTDLYTIHTLILTSTIHLHFDSMSRKNFNAASELIELINFLYPKDYCYLDPILAVCIVLIVSSRDTLLINPFFCVIDLLVLYYCQLSPYGEHRYQ